MLDLERLLTGRKLVSCSLEENVVLKVPIFGLGSATDQARLHAGLHPVQGAAAGGAIPFANISSRRCHLQKVGWETCSGGDGRPHHLLGVQSWQLLNLGHCCQWCGDSRLYWWNQEGRGVEIGPDAIQQSWIVSCKEVHISLEAGCWRVVQVLVAEELLHAVDDQPGAQVQLDCRLAAQAERRL